MQISLYLSSSILLRQECQLIAKVHFDDVIVRVVYERDRNTTQFQVLGLIKSNIIALAELKLEIFRNKKLDVV